MASIDETMNKMMEDILEFSRIGRVESSKEKVDIKFLINEALSLMKDDIDKKNALIKIDGEFPVISCYKARVTQIFLNLISNSLKYVQEDKQLEITIGCVQKDGIYWFYVKDNGIGINKEFQSKIFQVFQRLHTDQSDYEREQADYIIGNDIDSQDSWSTFDDEEGDWVVPRLTLHKIHRDYRKEMQSKAINSIIFAQKGEYSPEILSEVRDRLFDEKSNVIYSDRRNWLRIEFAKKYFDMLSPEHRAMLDDITKRHIMRQMPQGEHKEQYRREILEDVSNILDDPELSFIFDEEYIRRSKETLLDIYDETSRQIKREAGASMMASINFSRAVKEPLVDFVEQLPESLIQKLARFSQKIRELGDNSVLPLHDNNWYRILSDIAHIFSMTKADTPTVQNYYKSLLPLWGNRAQGDPGFSYSPINVDTLGNAISNLGPQNGRDFIPFIQEKLEESIHFQQNLPERLQQSNELWRADSQIREADKNTERLYYILEVLQSGQASGKYKWSKSGKKIMTTNWYRAILGQNKRSNSKNNDNDLSPDYSSFSKISVVSSNWYHRLKLAQLSGEFWITDSGQVMFADGDIGDYNHEAYVIESILSKYDLSWDGNMIDVNSPDFIENYVRENQDEVIEWLHENDLLTDEQFQGFEADPYSIDPDVIYDLGINNMTNSDIFMLMGMSEEEAMIAEGHGDARLFAMKNWGWKRLEGIHVETWSLTSSDMRTIADGLWDAYDEAAERGKYTIFIESDKSFFQNIPYPVIASGKPAALRDFNLRGQLRDFNLPG